MMNEKKWFSIMNGKWKMENFGDTAWFRRLKPAVNKVPSLRDCLFVVSFPHNDACVSVAKGLKALNQQRRATPCETVPAQTTALKGRNPIATVENVDCAPLGLDDRCGHIRMAMPCAVEYRAFSPLKLTSFLSRHCERSEAIHIPRSNRMALIYPVMDNMPVENGNTGISTATSLLSRHCERSEAIHIPQSNHASSICPFRDNMLVENGNTLISSAVPLGTECGLLRTHFIPVARSRNNHNNHSKTTVQTASTATVHNSQSRRDFQGVIAVGFSQRKQRQTANGLLRFARNDGEKKVLRNDGAGRLLHKTVWREFFTMRQYFSINKKSWFIQLKSQLIRK